MCVRERERAKLVDSTSTLSPLLHCHRHYRPHRRHHHHHCQRLLCRDRGAEDVRILRSERGRSPPTNQGLTPNPINISSSTPPLSLSIFVADRRQQTRPRPLPPAVRSARLLQVYGLEHCRRIFVVVVVVLKRSEAKRLRRICAVPSPLSHQLSLWSGLEAILIACLHCIIQQRIRIASHRIEHRASSHKQGPPRVSSRLISTDYARTQTCAKSTLASPTQTRRRWALLPPFTTAEPSTAPRLSRSSTRSTTSPTSPPPRDESGTS